MLSIVLLLSCLLSGDLFAQKPAGANGSPALPAKHTPSATNE